MGLLLTILTLCSGLVALRIWYGQSYAFLKHFSEKLIPYEKSIGLILFIMGVYSFFNHLGMLSGPNRISFPHVLYDLARVVLGFYQAFPILLLLVNDENKRTRFIDIKNRFEPYYPFAGLMAVVLAISDILSPFFL